MGGDREKEQGTRKGDVVSTQVARDRDVVRHRREGVRKRVFFCIWQKVRSLLQATGAA